MHIINDKIVPLASSVADYFVAASITDYELDGNQEAMVTFLSLIRIQALREKLKTIGLSLLSTSRAFYVVPFVLGCGIQLAHVPAKQYLKDHEKDPLNAKKIASKLVVVLSHVINTHSNHLINTISLVSSVAMIHFGFPFMGTVGILNIALIVLKKNRQIPAFIEHYALTPLKAFAYIGTLLDKTSSWAMRAVAIYSIWAAQQAFVHNKKGAQASGNKAIPLPSVELDPGRSLGGFLSKNNRPDYLKYLVKQEGEFTINRTSFFDPCLQEVFSLEDKEKLKDIKIEDLERKIRSKIQEKKLSLSEEEKRGLENIIEGAKGNIAGGTPPNFEKFQMVMKNVLFSISNREEELEKKNASLPNGEMDFENKIKHLATIGNKCNLRWLPESTAFLNPQANSYRWSLHNELSLFRGYLLEAHAMEALNGTRFSKYLVGGANDTHIHQEIEKVMGISLMTFKGRLHQSLFYGEEEVIQNAIKSFFWKKMQGNPVSVLNNISQMRAIHSLTDLPFYLNLEHYAMKKELFINAIFSRVMADYSPERVVDYLYEKMTPQYVSERAGEMTLQPMAISWESLCTWQSEINEKLSQLNIDLTEEKDRELFIQEDVVGTPFLTKAGIRLLLWDLGVFQKC